MNVDNSNSKDRDALASDATYEIKGIDKKPSVRCVKGNTELEHKYISSLYPLKISGEASGDIMALEVARVTKPVEDAHYRLFWIKF